MRNGETSLDGDGCCCPFNWHTSQCIDTIPSDRRSHSNSPIVCNRNRRQQFSHNRRYPYRCCPTPRKRVQLSHLIDVAMNFVVVSTSFVPNRQHSESSVGQVSFAQSKGFPMMNSIDPDFADSEVALVCFWFRPLRRNIPFSKRNQNADQNINSTYFRLHSIVFVLNDKPLLRNALPPSCGSRYDMFWRRNITNTFTPSQAVFSTPAAATPNASRKCSNNLVADKNRFSLDPMLNSPVDRSRKLAQLLLRANQSIYRAEGVSCEYQKT